MPTVTIETNDDGRFVYRKSPLDSIETARLAHEASVLERIRHPNVVAVQGFDGTSVVLAYAGRHDLNETDVTSLDQVTAIGCSVLSTLADVAELGWCHGAIGPSHAIRSDRGRVTLCSWGRARSITSADDRYALTDVADTAAMLRGLTATIESEPGRAGRRRVGQWTTLLDELATAPVSARDAASTIEAFRNAAPASRDKLNLPSLPKRGRGPRPLGSTSSAGPRRRHPVVGPALSQVVVLGACVLAMWLIVRLPSIVEPPGGPVRAVGGTPAPILFALSAFRWFAIGAAVYGAALAAIGVVGVLARRESWLAVQRRLAPPFVAKLLVGVTALGVASAAATPFAPLESSQTVAVADPPVTSSAPTPFSPPSSTPGPPVTSIAPKTTTSPATAPTAGPPVEAPTATTTPTTTSAVDEPVPTPALPVWIIERGDHLWRVAERTLNGRLGRAPSVAEITAYWRQVIDVNRPTLADPDNPDLVFAGQVIELPPGP